MRRLRLVTLVAVLMVAFLPAGTFADAASAPPAVTDLATYGTNAAVSLEWTNPPASSFSSVVVRYAAGSMAPATPSNGTPATPASAKASSVDLTGLGLDTQYAVSVWTRKVGVYSAPAVITFTSDAAPHAQHGTIVGKVADRNGHPLRGVKVAASSYTSLGSTYTASTGIDGRYRIRANVGSYAVNFDAMNATGGDSDGTGYIGDSAFVDVEPGHPTSTNERLRPGGAVRVRVTDSRGHPLAGVAVRPQPVSPYVQGSSGSSLFFSTDDVTLTNAHGVTVLKGIVGQALLVCFDGSGHVTGGTGGKAGYSSRCAPAPRVIAAGRTRSLPVVRLSAATGGILTGTIRTVAGTPVPRATVEFTHARDFVDHVSTGARGTYRSPAVPPGTYGVCVRPAATTAARFGLRARCVHGVQVSPGQVVRADLTVHRGAAVTGKVTGAHGAPVSGVGVSIARIGGATFGYARTDADGRYRVIGLGPGRYTACFDTSDASDPTTPTGHRGGCYQHKAVFGVRVGAERIGIDKRLGSGGRLTGRVLEHDGTAAKHVSVSVEPDDFRSGDFGFAEVAADGTYEVGNLKAGAYRVCFEREPAGGGGTFTFTYSSDDDDQDCLPGLVHVQPGSTVDDPDHTLPAVGSIELHVADQTGRPLAGVDAVALSHCPDDQAPCEPDPLFSRSKNVVIAASAVTSAEGKVTIQDVAPGRYAVCLHAYYGTTSAARSRTGYIDRCTAGFDLVVKPDDVASIGRTLRPAGLVTGRVTDSAGHPLSNVGVHVSNAATDDYGDPFDDDQLDSPFAPTSPAADARTDSSGRYTIRGVRPGRQTVCMDATNAGGGTSTGGYLDQCVGGKPSPTKPAARIRVSAGSSTHVRALRLTSAGAIVGTVRNVRGTPVRDASVEVLDHHGRRVAFAQSDAHGRYRAANLPSGRYTVCFDTFRTYRPQCYRDVLWDEDQVPAGATAVSARSGRTTRGIDAELHR